MFRFYKYLFSGILVFQHCKFIYLEIAKTVLVNSSLNILIANLLINHISVFMDHEVWAF